MVLRGFQADRNPAAGFGKLDGIGKQIVPDMGQQFCVRGDHHTVFHVGFDVKVFLLPGFLKLQKTFADLLAEIVLRRNRKNLLVFKLIQLQNIGNQIGKTAAGIGDRFGVFQTLLFGQIRRLQHGTVILHDRQRCFQFMGHVGHKVRPQRFHTGQLFCQPIEAVPNLVEHILPDDSVDRGNTYAEISFAHFLRCPDDLPDRTDDDKTPADAVK